VHFRFQRLRSNEYEHLRLNEVISLKGGAWRWVDVKILTVRCQYATAASAFVGQWPMWRQQYRFRPADKPADVLHSVIERLAGIQRDNLRLFGSITAPHHQTR
jgi:hypothetical protein